MDVYCCSRTIQAANWVSPTRAKNKRVVFVIVRTLAHRLCVCSALHDSDERGGAALLQRED